MRTLNIETATHGRVLIRDSAVAPAPGLAVAFHGYGQNAEVMLADLSSVPGADAWTIASVQALHPFYTRDTETVIASWMTRQDRDLAIADNVAYVDRAVDAIRESAPGAGDPGPDARPIVFIGFSQGAAMAYRAAVLGRHRAGAVIAIAGDIPPEVKAAENRAWPRVYLAAGEEDRWYTAEKAEADVAFLKSRAALVEQFRHRGGHEWTGDVRDAVGRWMSRSRAIA